MRMADAYMGVKIKLVPESYGPSRHLRGQWSVALLQVIAFDAARRSAAGITLDLT